MERDSGELEGELVNAVSDVERCRLEEAGALGARLSRKLRELAVLQWTEHEDVRLVRSTLARSALVRETYLSRCAREQPDTGSPHCVAGRYEPLLDAIAAHRLDLARSIARLSPRAWRRGAESYADHVYGRALGALALDSDDEARSMVAELGGEPDDYSRVRWRVLTCVRARSRDGLAAAFDALLGSRDADERLCVEGVALLILASRRGVSGPFGLEACPDVLVAE